MNNTVIIIGGGLGGLFTGAFLAKDGYLVTVIEKNKTIGGGLQTFERYGHVFETGMHILGGFRPGGSLDKMCEYLGIRRDLSIKAMDNDCIDTVTYLSDNTTYRIPEGRDAFVKYLQGQFPHENANIERYVEKIYSIANEVDFFYLRKGNNSIFAHSEEFMWPADELISHYIGDPRLQDLLGFINPMYGGVKGHTPAYIHALITVLHLDGADRFVGGSLQLAEALARVIEENGGSIVSDEEVVKVHVGSARDRKLVEEVITNKGKTYKGDCYVSSIHPCTLLDKIDEHAFTKSFRERLRSVPNTYSSFGIYISFKPNSFPYINHTCYFQDDYGIVWNHGDYDAASWPRGFMYMTPPDHDSDSKFASRMVVNCIMSYDVVKKWSDSAPMKRGQEYDAWKLEHVKKVLAKLELLHPGIGQMIEHITASSPLTIRDYYSVKEGALYGFRRDCKNIALSQLSVFSKVKNLFFTGQCVNLHGICGVPLTAINTVEAITANPDFIDKINNHYNTLNKS